MGLFFLRDGRLLRLQDAVDFLDDERRQGLGFAGVPRELWRNGLIGVGDRFRYYAEVFDGHCYEWLEVYEPIKEGRFFSGGHYIKVPMSNRLLMTLHVKHMRRKDGSYFSISPQGPYLISPEEIAAGDQPASGIATAVAGDPDWNHNERGPAPADDAETGMSEQRALT